ncbi:MAG: RAMP superfamily CRISPR-associated protein [Bacteroidota bacterium]
MITQPYEIVFFTYWHTGSGLSGGADLNATVIKNESLLPYIPGKTLKGLLRDAATSLNELNPQLVSQSFIEEVFGKENKETYLNTGCYFSDAQLAPALAKKIVDEKLQSFLYDRLASTAIDENGQAKDHSLRHIEATIPLKLYAFIEDFPSNPEHDLALKSSFQWIKQLGLNRTRGLGRCQFSTPNVSKGEKNLS